MKKVIVYTMCLCFLAMSMTLFAGAEEKNEKVGVNVYGYIKLDAAYETGRSSHGNYAFWATDPGDSDGLFHMTANETRLGFNVKGFSFGDYKVTGKLEMDFHAGNSENKAFNYMRHAFIKVSNGSLTIIAGQTWDIINPLNAATLNYPVLWGSGNVGYRRPQLRIEQLFKSGKNSFLLQAGIFRTIAGDYDSDGNKDGIAAGYPMIQGRISGKFGMGKGFMQLGVSGHYGKTKGDVDYNTSSINGDFMWVLSPKFKVAAEFFSGENMGAMLGGIIQTVNTSLGEPIKTKGFFVNAIANPTKKIRLSLGYGMDDPDDDQLGLNSRAKNTAIFGNILFNLSRSVRCGFEVANWATDYLVENVVGPNFLGLERQKTTRFQHSWILSF